MPIPILVWVVAGAAGGSIGGWFAARVVDTGKTTADGVAASITGTARTLGSAVTGAGTWWLLGKFVPKGALGGRNKRDVAIAAASIGAAIVAYASGRPSGPAPPALGVAGFDSIDVDDVRAIDVERVS